MSVRLPALTLALLVCAAALLGACAPQPAIRSEPARPTEAARPTVQPTAITAAKPSEAVKPAAAPVTASVADKRIPKLTIDVPLDTGPLNIYTSDTAFDYLVELVYDKLLAPSPYAEKPLPGLAESATQVDPNSWVV